jgi:hypothetical protein
VPNPPPVKPVVDTVTVNVIERGPWAAGQHQFTRADPVLHHALQQPAMRSPRPEPPPVAAPGEPYLRQQLGIAVKSAERADKDFRDAEAAHKRAVEHLEKCQSHAASFFGLDAENAAALAGAFRSNTDVGAVQEIYSEKLAERAVAQAELTAAQAVVTKLQAERDAAAQRASTMQDAVHLLAVRVLAFSADAIAEECRELQAEINRRWRVLIGYNLLATSAKIGLSQLVRTVLGDLTVQDISNIDTRDWKQAITDLRRDPDADITIPLPPAVVRPLPMVQIARPVQFEPVPPEAPDDGDPGLITEEPPAA